MDDGVVLVTGANSGIGLSLVRSLRETGRTVCGIDLRTDALAEVPSRACDVTRPDEVRASIDSVISEFGSIGVLVNNACIAVFAPFEERSVDDIRREVEVDFFGYLNMIEAVLPHMRARGGGVIHNVSSTVGATGFAGLVGYTSAKGAIEAMTRTLALELREDGIVVNLIHPPLTRTPSASPLGVPDEFMTDPAEVGKRLAARIGSTSPVVTTGPSVTLGVIASRLFPVAMGRFMSDRASDARASDG